jgi:hypothetical protein
MGNFAQDGEGGRQQNFPVGKVGAGTGDIDCQLAAIDNGCVHFPITGH